MPPKAAADDSVQGLTPSELKFIKAVFDNMTQKPDADWSKVAEALSLKDAKCAKERFRQMSKRHNWNNAEPGSGTVTPRKPKSGATGAGVKKPRASKKGKKSEEDEVKEEDSEEAVKDESQEENFD